MAEIAFFKLLALMTSSLLVVCENFELTILHTNDVHSHVEQFNKYGGTCTGDQNQCFGGVARRHTVVEQIRNSTKNVLLLDGGDQFSGTLWFTQYQGMAAVRFMNYTGYDAMAIGNHEFDKSPQGLINFLKEANFSVLSSNLDVSKEPIWPKPDTLYKRSVVLERNGKKIGVIGFTTQNTKWLSRPGENIEFKDEISSIQEEAKKLKEQGINILIAVGHSGFKKDQEIAKEVKDLDVVVGGHTNTFLYNGAKPSNDEIEGPYPIVVNRADGTKCLVVQDFHYGKYLGNLKVVFDGTNGVLKSWSGNPIMLNATYKQDENVLEMVQQMSVPIHEARNKSVGRSLVYLQGSREICRTTECNLGNMITDAIVKSTQQSPDDKKWASVALGLWNGGGIRSDIDKKINEWITLEELNTILPFGNTADIIEIKGKYLLQSFEHGLSGLPQLVGRFLQVSGFKVQFDSLKPVGSRLVEVLVLCIECRVPEYKLLENEKLYKVVVSNYLAEGGDGHAPLKNFSQRHPGPDALLFFEKYFKKESPVSPAIEGRIVDISKTAKKECKSNSSVDHVSNILTFLLCLVFCLCMA